MIDVSCRNGEHVPLDPDAIARVESRGDTTVVLQDGTMVVIGQDIDQLIRIVRDDRASMVSARRRLDGPQPAPGFVPHRASRFARPHPGSAQD